VLGSTRTARIVASIVVSTVAAFACFGALTLTADAQTPPPPPAPNDPATVSAFADAMVTPAIDDFNLPFSSVPTAAEGVLGTHAETVRRIVAIVQANQRRALAAWYAAQAAARRGPAVGSPSRATSGGHRSSRCNGDFACFKACTLQIESHGNYGAISPGGTYRGAWQFDQSTWNGAVARAGYPEWSGHDPASAPAGVQDAAAHQLYLERGNQPWGGRC